jgi:hypothetical protein
MDRRGFLTVAGRYALLGSLVAVSAVCLKRGEVGRDGDCRISSFCSDCRLLPGCDLPDALDAKDSPAGIS